MKLFLLLLTFCFTVILNAQVNKETLEAEALQYFEFVETNNSEGVINYMHPKVFETIPKAQMKAGMDQMLDNEEMKIEFLSSEINKMSDIIENKGNAYVNINYTNEMRMIFLSEKDKSVEEKTAFMDFIKKTMETQFGADNVISDAENLALIVTVKSHLYAVYNEVFGGWKFVGNDDVMAKVINTIIPEKIRLAFNRN